MSFTAPRSDTPNKLLVHRTGFINHLCCLQNWSDKWATPVVEETLTHGILRPENQTDVNHQWLR